MSDDVVNDDDAQEDDQVQGDKDIEQLTRVVVRRKTASRKDVVLFHIYQRRTDLHHFAWNTGLLGQQYLIDEFLASESDRLNYVRTNNAKKHVAHQRDVEEYVAQHYAKKGVMIGSHITLPGNFTGSARYKAHLFNNCSALFTATRRPMWFITFTGNPHWRDITENLMVDEFIKVPPAMWLQTDAAVIDWLYDPDTLASQERMSEVALLTVKNNMTMVLNARIMSMLPSTPICLIGTNEVLVDKDAAPNIPVMQPEAVFIHLTNGFPPTQLVLKQGAIVMLLHNIDVSAGLCNGTRLVVKAFANNSILHCGRIGAGADAQDVLLPRIDFVFHSPDGVVNFRRRQFPVCPAFSMTINKSQGQTFRRHRSV